MFLIGTWLLISEIKKLTQFVSLSQISINDEKWKTKKKIRNQLKQCRNSQHIDHIDI